MITLRLPSPIWPGRPRGSDSPGSVTLADAAARRRTAIAGRQEIRRIGELRRTLRVGGPFVVPILVFTGFVMESRQVGHDGQLFALWSAAAFATAIQARVARRAGARIVVALTLVFTLMPIVCLLTTFAIAPVTVLMMDSGLGTLPVATPLFLPWSDRLRRSWLVGYALIVGGVIGAGVGGLDGANRTDLVSNILVACVIGGVGGELLARARRQATAHAYDLHRANTRLRAFATTDPLTGLANRRQLDADIATLRAAHARDGGRCSLVLLDLDRFKSLNDERGHQAGDAALQAVAEELRSHVRAPDSAYRLGGEEFLVVLPSTTRVEAAAVAERLRRAVAALAISRSADGSVALTVSGGVAECTQIDDYELVLTRADEALYAAKAAGRDRIVVSLHPLEHDRVQAARVEPARGRRET